MLFTPTELSWILAGRDTKSAQYTREIFNLADLKEGDPKVLDAVQSLIARGMAEVEGDEVKPSDAIALLGFTLSNADYWAQLTLKVEDDDPEILFTVGNEGLRSVFFIRMAALGVVEVSVSNPDTHPSIAFGTLLETYAEAEPDVTIGLSRGFKEPQSRLFMAQRVGDEWQMLRREGITASKDVAKGESLAVDLPEIYANAQELLN